MLWVTITMVTSELSSLMVSSIPPRGRRLRRFLFEKAHGWMTRANQDVGEDPAAGISLGTAAGIRERNGRPGHEHERRLNQVPKRATGPGHMSELVGQGLPHRTVRELFGYLGDAELAPRQDDHDKAAVGVEGRESGRWLRLWCGEVFCFIFHGILVGSVSE